MKDRCVSFGEVERQYCFGWLRRWEPLRLEWRSCRSHFVIKSDRTEDWLALTKQIIESVLEQNGRVLIVDRRDPGPEGVLEGPRLDIANMPFAGRLPHALSNLDDEELIDAFLHVRSPLADEKRLLYVPPEVALAEEADQIPSILRYVREGFCRRFGANSEGGDSNEALMAEQASWDKAVPALILTLGRSWIDRGPATASQLRAISVAQFHVVMSGYDLTAITSANSRGFLQLSSSQSSESLLAKGLIEFRECDPRHPQESRQVYTLFRLGGVKKDGR